MRAINAEIIAVSIAVTIIQIINAIKPSGSLQNERNKRYKAPTP